MSRSSLHPDLNPRRMLKFSVFPWNLRLVRFFFRVFVPPVKCPKNLEVSVKRVNKQKFHICRPTNAVSRAALLWFHGGGLILGSPSQEKATCLQFADKLGITVIAVSYRLAPEHPFPAPLDDCFLAWKTLQNQAKMFGIDPQQIAIGGISAGGGLAASLALRIRDDGGIQPIAQLLVCPMLDDRTTMREDIAMKEHAVWNQRSNITGWGSYLGERRGSESLPPYAAAARAEDFAGLPPAWLGVGTLDLFYEEDVVYARRLEEAGVSTTLETVEGGYHAFHTFDPAAPVSQKHVESQLTFLRKELAKHA